MSPRIRPTLQDYKDAQDLFWLGDGGYWMIDDRTDGLWTVYASRDVLDHTVVATVESLADAIRVARAREAETSETAEEAKGVPDE
jgi:hypothetical protein